MSLVGDQTVNWRRVYQALDPLAPIQPGSEAYCERPERPLSRLVATLRLSKRPSLYLVSGHIGTGKSTELFRLADELSDTHRCFLEQVDADLLRGTADDEVFVNMLGLALEALEAGEDWKKLKRRKELAARWRKLLMTSIKVSGPGLKIRPRTLELSESMSRLLEQSAKMAEKVRARWGEPLVVLDGFDKVGLADLERLFAAVSSWDFLPVSVVLTVPLSFLFTPLFARSQSLFARTAVVPAIRVLRSDGKADAEHFEWMRFLLHRRIAGDLVDHDAAEYLVAQTGGILRDFLRVARESVLTAHMKKGDRVTRGYVEDAVQDFSLSMSRAVSPDDLRLLYSVLRAGRVIGDASFLQMIDSGHIIEYRNGANWYAVHPLLHEAVEALGPALEARAS